MSAIKLRYATKDDGTVAGVLDVVSDIIEGGRHSRCWIITTKKVRL